MDQSKRAFLVGAGAAGLLSPAGAALGAPLTETPDMALGPYYPVRKPSESDADLTRIKGHSGRAKGQIIEVSGRIVTPDGKPQPKARLEIWQCNTFGHYNHPNDHSKTAADPDFQGSAVLVADEAGRFRFLTIKPPRYPAPDFTRAPHIHFDVQGDRQRLITQMYFKVEEALMRQDKVLMTDMSWYDKPFPDHIFGQASKEPTRLEAGVDHYTFDIVLSGA